MLTQDLLDGKQWDAPDPIGSVTPSSGKFTSLNVTGLTPLQTVSTDASNNLISTAASVGAVPATPNTLVLRDAYGNTQSNNALMATLIIVTAGGTTNLSNSTPNQLLFTGTLGQTVKFPTPGAGGWIVGTEFRINNDSTAGLVTVQNNVGSTIGTVPFGGLGVLILTSASGTGTWQLHGLAANATTWGTTLFFTPSALQTTDATQSTSTLTGSIKTAGGLGVVKDVWIGGTLNVAGGIPGIPVSKTFWQIESTKEVGTVFGLQMATSFTSMPIYAYQYFQSPAAINDQWSQTFTMAAGTFALSAIGLTAPNRGIISWYVDGVLQGTMDYYANPGLTNSIKTISVTILTAGTHTIRAILATKNAASTDYFCTLQQFWIKP